MWTLQQNLFNIQSCSRSCKAKTSKIPHVYIMSKDLHSQSKTYVTSNQRSLLWWNRRQLVPMSVVPSESTNQCRVERTFEFTTSDAEGTYLSSLWSSSICEIHGNDSSTRRYFYLFRIPDLLQYTVFEDHPAHYSKSQIFVQKFNFDKTLTFSRVFHTNFLTNYLVKSKLSTA